jgi:Flp pilus assembly protein TadD
VRTALLSRLALHRFVQEDTATALAMMRRVVHRDPSSGTARLRLGWLLARAGARDEALRYLTDAIWQLPFDSRAFVLRGTLLRAHDPEQAIEDYSMALLSGGPDTARLYMLRGVTYFRLGRHRLALCDYLDALESDPGCHIARCNAARILMHCHLDNAHAACRHRAAASGMHGAATAPSSHRRQATEEEGARDTLHFALGLLHAIVTPSPSVRAAIAPVYPLRDGARYTGDATTAATPHLLAARCWLMLGDIRCAGREASRALFLAPDMPEAWEMRARCILTQVQWLFFF